MKTMAMLVDAIPNAELRGGYLAQMLDEARDVHIESSCCATWRRSRPTPPATTAR